MIIFLISEAVHAYYQKMISISKIKKFKCPYFYLHKNFSFQNLLGPCLCLIVGVLSCETCHFLLWYKDLFLWTYLALFAMTIVMCHFTRGIRSEKCIIRWFCHASVTEPQPGSLGWPIAPRSPTCTACYGTKHEIKSSTGESDAIQGL